MNKDIKGSANIKPGWSKEKFVHYYKELWNNKPLEENYCNTEILMTKLEQRKNWKRY